MDFSIIFIGSTHSFIKDFIKQKEIINEFNPEFVLCETLENISLDTKEKYEDILKNKKISNMTSFEEVEDLIKLCNKKNIKLVGIDFENFGFNENLQEKIKNQEELSNKEEEEIEELVKERQKNHLEKINEFKEKTNQPIIVIVGSWHLSEDSPLMTKLNNYKTIFPCDENKKLVTEPTKNISYCEKCKKN